MWVHTVSVSSPPPSTALPHALVMRRRLIDWGWRYDYLASPPPSSPLFTFSYSLPQPGHSSERDKGCFLHVYWFVLIERKPTDSLPIKDGGRARRAHRGPAGCLCGPAWSPAWMICFELPLWMNTYTEDQPSELLEKHSVNGFPRDCFCSRLLTFASFRMLEKPMRRF